jgi:hypothetical protein
MQLPRVFLVFGEHGSGKTTKVAAPLKAAHHFEVVSVDKVYVEWVKSQCPSLYFEDLSKYIFQHYNSILIGDYTVEVFKGRNVVAEWHAHLLDHIIEQSQQHNSLVVEGYLLFDCKDAYTIELAKLPVQVFQIPVEHDQPFLISPLTGCRDGRLGQRLRAR